MPRNVEVKVRATDLGPVLARALALGAVDAGTLEQTDRYYEVSPTGGERLKLRTTPGGPAQLVRYRRPEVADVRVSDYEVSPVHDGEVRICLVPKARPLTTVRKRRHLLLLDNVRIHLDSVEGLGEFVELEAVVDDAHDEVSCRRRIDELVEALGLCGEAMVRASYSDLSMAAAAPPRILLSGLPGCGKTTLVGRVVDALGPGACAGIVTEEVRDRGGRTGFRVRSLDGVEGVLARVSAGPGPRLGRYVVDVADLERVALPALARRPGVRVFVVDEIGKMESHSAAFVAAVRRLIEAPVALLATIPARHAAGDLLRLLSDVRRAPGVVQIEVTAGNRDALPAELAARLMAFLNLASAARSLARGAPAA